MQYQFTKGSLPLSEAMYNRIADGRIPSLKSAEQTVEALSNN